MPFTRAPSCATAPLGEKKRFYQTAGGGVTEQRPSAIVRSSDRRNAATRRRRPSLTRPTLATPRRAGGSPSSPRPCQHERRGRSGREPGMTNSESCVLAAAVVDVGDRAVEQAAVAAADEVEAARGRGHERAARCPARRTTRSGASDRRSRPARAPAACRSSARDRRASSQATKGAEPRAPEDEHEGSAASAAASQTRRRRVTGFARAGGGRAAARPWGSAGAGRLAQPRPRSVALRVRLGAGRRAGGEVRLDRARGRRAASAPST